MAIDMPSRDFTWVPPVFDDSGRKEGGLTFLKRMLQTAIETGERVVFSDGTRVFGYTHSGDHRVFCDGVTQLDTAEAKGIVAEEMDKNMSNYAIPLGIKELHREGKIAATSKGVDNATLRHFAPN